MEINLLADALEMEIKNKPGINMYSIYRAYESILAYVDLRFPGSIVPEN